MYNTLRKSFLDPALHLFNADFDSLVAFAKKAEETQQNNSTLIFTIGRKCPLKTKILKRISLLSDSLIHQTLNNLLVTKHNIPANTKSADLHGKN